MPFVEKSLGIESRQPHEASLCFASFGDVYMELTRLQLLALEACQQSKSEMRETCYKWLPRRYKDMGVNPHHLKHLETLGRLLRAEGSSRNWYKMVNPTSPAASASLANPSTSGR